MVNPNWITCQLGAREHYAVPRALALSGRLRRLLTDAWVSAGSAYRLLPGLKALKERSSADLSSHRVAAATLSSLRFEVENRLTRRRAGWDLIQARNQHFQNRALRLLRKEMAGCDDQCLINLFAYSYAAKDIFTAARRRGWRCVLGQIDPGPEEERIVIAEHERYPHVGSRWQAAPTRYWDNWWREIDLADAVVINSAWSRQCLTTDGVDDSKLKIIPLVYSPAAGLNRSPNATGILSDDHDRLATCQKRFELLFLGQVNLRKGIGRLIDAMRLLADDRSIHLTIAGPLEIDLGFFENLSNVTYVGPVPRSEVGRLYQQADAMILPTLSDGFALTQLECLAYGTPVVASRYCGTVVQDGINGLILPDIEPTTIATVVSRMAEKPMIRPIPAEAGFSLNDLAGALMDLES